MRSFHFKLLLLCAAIAIPFIVFDAVLGQRLAGEALRSSEYKSLHAAALRTALRLDSFVKGQLRLVQREARLPMFANVLGMGIGADERDVLLMEIKHTLESLIAEDRVYSATASLLDGEGRVLVSTGSVQSQRNRPPNRAEQAFFEEVVARGRPGVSPTIFHEDGRVRIYFGAPVFKDSGPIGMLRIGYSSRVWHHLIVRDNGTMGPASFPVLFDDKYLCLADGTSSPGRRSELLHRFPMPPSSVAIANYQTGLQLPAEFDNGTLRLSDLEMGLQTADSAAIGFVTDIPGVADGQLAAAAVRMESMPWIVGFFQSVDVFLAPVQERQQQVLYQSVALVVGALLLAAWATRRLTRPIDTLTSVAHRFGKGALEVRAEVDTKDEIGSLAAAFNEMAQLLQQRIESQALMTQVSKYFSDEYAGPDEAVPETEEILRAIAWHFTVDHVCIYAVDRRYQRELKNIFVYPMPASGLRDDCPEVRDIAWLERRMRRSDGKGKAESRQFNVSKRPHWAACGLQALVMTPIVDGNNRLGMLCLAAERKAISWSEAEESTASMLCETVGRSLHRHWAELEIRSLNEGLERRVIARTKQWQSANRKLEGEIEERKRVQSERDNMHRQLYDLARRAGMAEVATTVLHNVGNALNSVGIAAFMISEILGQSQYGKLRQLCGLLEANEDQLSEFFASSKGKLVLPYLTKLDTAITEEHSKVGRELTSLRKSLEHANQIVRAQQSIAGTVDASEDMEPKSLMEDAYRICAGSVERNGIRIIREYEDGLPRIRLGRHKAVQILVNLLNNAKDALRSHSGDVAEIVMRVRRRDDEFVCFQIADNGVGIDKAHTSELFRYGFTTKPDGHGFGLHGSALTARDLGGELSFESEGVGHGAIFSLILPVNRGGRDKGGGESANKGSDNGALDFNRDRIQAAIAEVEERDVAGDRGAADEVGEAASEVKEIGDADQAHDQDAFRPNQEGQAAAQGRSRDASTRETGAGGEYRQAK